jgi:hypothetical protein
VARSGSTSMEWRFERCDAHLAMTVAVRSSRGRRAAPCGERPPAARAAGGRSPRVHHLGRAGGDQSRKTAACPCPSPAGSARSHIVTSLIQNSSPLLVLRSPS